MPKKKQTYTPLPLGPVSWEERQKKEKIRLARIERHSRAHQALLRREEIAELRRLECSKTRCWSEELFLSFLKRKYGDAK